VDEVERLARCVLLAGSVAMAQDQPAPSSQPAPQAQSASPSTPATPAAAPTPAAKAKPTVRSAKKISRTASRKGEERQLTAGETANLETKEAAINARPKRTARPTRQADGGGEETDQRAAESNVQADLQGQAQRQHAALWKQQSGQRRENQQDRIAQGIKSGQMTAGEAAKAKSAEGINQQVAADRKANGGTLTASEKKQSTRTERGIEEHLSQEAQREDAAAGAAKP